MTADTCQPARGQRCVGGGERSGRTGDSGAATGERSPVGSLASIVPMFLCDSDAIDVEFERAKRGNGRIKVLTALFLRGTGYKP